MGADGGDTLLLGSGPAPRSGHSGIGTRARPGAAHVLHEEAGRAAWLPCHLKPSQQLCRFCLYHSEASGLRGP